MITLQKAIELCIIRVINPNASQHKHYEKVTELAELYEQLITGEDQDDLIEQFFTKENKDEVKKICEITKPVTASVSNSLIAAFKKVLRTKPVVKKIDFVKVEDKKRDRILAAIDNYHSGKSLDNYIVKRFHDLTFTDPNSFIVAEFETSVDSTKEPRIYPFEVSSEEAVNYSFVNGILQFLLVEQEIKFINAVGEPKQGKKLIIYLDDHAIQLTEQAKTLQIAVPDKAGFATQNDLVIIETRNDSGKFIEGSEEMPVILVTKDDRQFSIQYFTHKHGRVPAERVGYVPDKTTRGETFVNPFHYGAIHYMLKSIKAVAEMDLSIHCHTFPQKIAYTESCDIDANGKCATSGQLISNCKMCGGKGHQAHTSAKDVQYIKLPRNKEEMIDLKQLIAYIYPPIEGIKFQSDYVNALKMDCYKGVFNSEVFSKDAVAATATGKNIDLQNVYDTLYDYATKVEDFWERMVEMIGAVLDIHDVIAELKYPHDFKLKSTTDLLEDLKKTNEGGAPSFIVNEINRDIAGQLYQDRKLEMQKYEVRQRLQPFSGKTRSEISLLLTQSDVKRLDKVSYNYFEQFMEELEEESLQPNAFSLLNIDDSLKKLLDASKSQNPPLLWFYDLPFNLQKGLLNAKAMQKMQEIEAEAPNAAPYGGGAPI